MWLDLIIMAPPQTRALSFFSSLTADEAFSLCEESLKDLASYDCLVHQLCIVPFQAGNILQKAQCTNLTFQVSKSAFASENVLRSYLLSEISNISFIFFFVCFFLFLDYFIFFFKVIKEYNYKISNRKSLNKTLCHKQCNRY